MTPNAPRATADGPGDPSVPDQKGEFLRSHSRNFLFKNSGAVWHEIDATFKARDIRVRYRVKFLGEGAMLDMIINAPLKPGKPGSVLWHIGDVVTRVTKPDACDDVAIAERDFARDTTHPSLTGKKLDPVILDTPEGTFSSAYGIPGAGTHAKIGLVTGRWYDAVVEAVGARWTLWVDGKETLTLDLKRSDFEKESVNFIGFGPLLLDDIVIEDLPRP